MANTQVRIRSPKGSVGVTDVVDAGELSAYSMGVLSGFDATSAASWTLQIGGSSTVQDVAIGRNPAGESELFVGTSATTVPFIIGGAPGTPGQSRTDALVLYKDPFTTTVVNNGLDVTDYAVVPGTAATTGTQVPPSMATIRSTIPTGSLKFVAVIGYVTIAYGASSVSTANYFKNPALISTQVVANQTVRDLITPIEGQKVWQADNDMLQIYDGSNWSNVPRLLAKTTLTAAGDTITVSSIPARDKLKILVDLIPSGNIAARLRFNNDIGTNYSSNVSTNFASPGTLLTSQTNITFDASIGGSATYYSKTVMEVTNMANKIKLVTSQNASIATVAASSAPNSTLSSSQWVNTVNQINRVDVNNGGSGDFGIGSCVEIWG